MEVWGAPFIQHNIWIRAEVVESLTYSIQILSEQYKDLSSMNYVLLQMEGVLKQLHVQNTEPQKSAVGFS